MKKGLKQKDNICLICSKEISQTTAAKASHMRKHVRDGSLKESKDESGKLVWETTGKDPQAKEVGRSSHRVVTKIVESRISTIAKSHKNGTIVIKCKKCNKFMKNPRKFADGSGTDRFVSITCCDATTLFPKRMLQTLINNPGKEYIE